MPVTVYHNSRCSKSRAALELLREAGKEVRVVDYLASPPTVEDLDRLLRLMNLEPEAVTRKKEDRYRELGLGERPPASREEWLRVLVENPILIERPIATDGKRAVIGRPPENVRALL